MALAGARGALFSREGYVGGRWGRHCHAGESQLPSPSMSRSSLEDSSGYYSSALNQIREKTPGPPQKPTYDGRDLTERQVKHVRDLRSRFDKYSTYSNLRTGEAPCCSSTRRPRFLRAGCPGRRAQAKRPAPPGAFHQRGTSHRTAGHMDSRPDNHTPHAGTQYAAD